MDVSLSRESGASAGQVEETPGRASLKKLVCRTPPQLHAGGVGRQQQHVFDGSWSEILQVEDAEFVRAKGITIPTALDCSPH